MAEKVEVEAAPQAQQPSSGTGTVTGGVGTGTVTGGVSSSERAVSAFVGYSCGAVVVLPFDRVKSLLQV